MVARRGCVPVSGAWAETRNHRRRDQVPQDGDSMIVRHMKPVEDYKNRTEKRRAERGILTAEEREAIARAVSDSALYQPRTNQAHEGDEPCS